jgi:hypothetical protein
LDPPVVAVGCELVDESRPWHAGKNSDVKLTESEALARLAVADHGILCTLHAERGVDAVPVAYALDADGYVGVPVDQVKPKASSRLQREQNLESDRDDWSRLSWVRVELHWQSSTDGDRAATLATLLAERYPQYHDQPFHRVLVLRIVGVTGWAGSSR